MFKKILVPLDGSKLAECALDYAEELALMSKAEKLTLISVTEKIKGVVYSSESGEKLLASNDSGLGELSNPSNRGFFPNANNVYSISAYSPISHDHTGVSVEIGKLEKQAQKYLIRIADRLQEKHLPVSTEVLIGKVAEEIIKYAHEGVYDVIVMSSHGRSGPSRWTYGSVTDKVFRSVCIPILVIRAPGCFPELEKKPTKKKK
jgi:nucleotide-binding universal stress UspA family protein